MHHFKIEAKRCDFNHDTAAIHIFIQSLKDVYNFTAKVYEKDPSMIKLVEMFSIVQQVIATLSPSMVNMISSDDGCLVCSKKGHIHHHCQDVQCYICDSFDHITQDCSEKIPTSGTPHHHDILHSCSCHNHNHRDRSHSFHHRHSQGNCFDRSGSHHQINVTEAPVTSGDMHPVLYPTITPAQNTLPQTDTLGDTPAGTSHTITDASLP